MKDIKTALNFMILLQKLLLLDHLCFNTEDVILPLSLKMEEYYFVEEIQVI